MAKDLPDFRLETTPAVVTADKVNSGLDADKAAVPEAGAIYYARDTKILYLCAQAGTWTGIDAASITEGILTLYANLAGGGHRITNIADPTAAQDAATRAYVLAQLASYLALAGGTMAGNIAMATHKITGLGDPTANQDAATRAYVLTNPLALSKVVWKATNADSLALTNQASTLEYTDLDLTSVTSALAKVAILLLRLNVVSITSDGIAQIMVRKDGDTPTFVPMLRLAYNNGDRAAAYRFEVVLCGMDSEQVIEYRLFISGTISVDANICVLGYIE